MGVHGRDAELDRIAGLLDAARTARGGSLVVRGPAGAGKTTLLDAAAASAEGFLVVRATCAQSERSLPYAALHQALWPAMDAIDRLPAPQAGALRQAFGLAAGDRPERFAAAVGTLSLLAELATARPLLCVVDDLQWADEASADALLFAGRRLGDEPVALLLGVRVEDAPALDGTVPVVDIAPLDADAALRLLEDKSGLGVSAAVRDRLLDATGGNALALSELAAALDRSQLSGLRRLPDPLPVSGGVARLYAARYARLPAPTRTALVVAALHGSGGLDTILRAAGELGADAGALQPAEDDGLIVVDGGQLGFRHPLVRSAVADSAPASVQRRAHAALARALGDDADRRAWHLAAAAMERDAEAAAALDAAAGRAEARGAFAPASHALERAAELSSGTARARRFARAAEHAWRGGSAGLAIALADRGAQAGPDEESTRLLARLRGTVETWAGRPERGCDILCREAELAAAADPELALRLLAEAAEAASFTGDDAMIVRVGDAAERLVTEPADHRSRLLRALLLGSQRISAGRVAEAGALLRAAVAGWEQLDDPEELNWAGRAAIYLGDERLCLRLNRRAGELARAEGSLFVLPSILLRTAITEVWLGRLKDAETDGGDALALARETGQEDLAAGSLAVLGYACALQGRLEDGRRRCAQAIEAARSRGLGLFEDFAAMGLGHADVAEGRYEPALTWLRGIRHPAVSLLAVVDRVEAGVAAGRHDVAAAGTAAAAEWARATELSAAAAIAAHCDAVCAAPGEAPVRFERALALHERHPRSFERARTELAYGRFLRRHRARARSREHLARAADRFDRLGASFWAKQARAELRATGASVRPRDPDARDSLTRQERRIAGYAATGLTNREIAARLFLSPRTVDFHLRNVFAKLGIASRTELARHPAIDVERADGGSPEPAG